MPRLADDEDAQYAMGRKPEQIHISRRWPYQAQDGSPELAGKAARFAYKVFDTWGDVVAENDGGLELVLRETPTRQQLKVVFFEDSRRIPRILFQRFNSKGEQIRRERFVLSDDEIRDLILFLSIIGLPSLSLGEDEFGLTLTAAAALELLSEDRESAQLLDDLRPVLAELFRSDVTAPEVIAYARRRAQLDRFDAMLNDSVAFDAESAKLASDGRRHGNEPTWQAFFEENQWVFGSGLAPQFLHAWDPESLEQTVRGASVARPGKRPDALMRTAGALSALVLVEIKSHRTPLIGSEYRTGVWPPSDELAAGVAQCQTTLDAAVEGLGRVLTQQDPDGFDTGEWAAVCRPRSLLVVGSLAQFEQEGRLNLPQFESFERYRRSLRDPELVTFDELYERANLALRLGDRDAPEAKLSAKATDQGSNQPTDLIDEAPF